MKKAIVAIAGLACLLASANDASAYVKKAKTKPRSSSATAVSSSTPGGFYVSGGVIYFPTVVFDSGDGSVDLESGRGLRLAVGKDNGNFRFEGELKYSDGAKYKESWSYYDTIYGWLPQHVEFRDRQFSIMFNGYYDINLSDNFGMSVTGGIGVVRDTIIVEWWGYNIYEEDTMHSKWLFGYQIGGGMSYNMSSSISFDLMYRFGGTSKREEGNIYSHELSLGARYRF